MFCSKIPEFLHGIFGNVKTDKTALSKNTGSFNSNIPHNFTERMSAQAQATPKKKPKNLHKNVTWMYVLCNTEGAAESELVVRMALCPTTSIPQDKCAWWINIQKPSKWADVSFLKDFQSTGIASFLNRL